LDSSDDDVRPNSTMASPFVKLPLRVEDGAMYWQRRSCSTPYAVEEQGIEEEEAAVEEEVCFWRRDQTSFLFPVEDPEWKGLASALLEEAPPKEEDGGRDDGDHDGGGGGDRSASSSSPSSTNLRIRAERLAEIVAESGGDPEVARHVAALTNAPHRPKLLTNADLRAVPPMLYQQLVFPPVSGLFYSFDPDRYAADSKVDSGIYSYQDAGGHWVRWKGRKADSAVKFSPCHLLLAMLELTKADRCDDDDHDDDDDILHKCVLMASVSALALVRESGNCATKVTLPFVVHYGGEWANLFTLTVERGGGGDSESCPVIRKLVVADMSDPTQRATMVAYLAVMLHRLMVDIRANDNLRALRLNLSSIPP
jgi:hypothetical protein